MAVLASITAVLGRPAAAATPIALTVTSSPNPVSTGQAVAYAITITNRGTSAATGVTLTDTLNGVGIGQMTAP
ncbi:MAG: hypothetical protein ACRDOE_25595, partial [Streptosporangiaceae bacterium]